MSSKSKLFSALQNQVADLKEMNSVLKKEIAELEKKLVHIRGVRNLISSHFSFIFFPKSLKKKTACFNQASPRFGSSTYLTKFPQRLPDSLSAQE